MKVWKKEWKERLVKVVAQKRSPGTVLSAFNSNIDAVVYLKKKHVESLCSEINCNLNEDLKIKTIKEKEDFLYVLKTALKESGAVHITLENIRLLDWFDEIFPNHEERIGGQAGIIANQMAALGLESVVYTPLLSPKQANMFLSDVKFPRVTKGDIDFRSISESSRKKDNLKINWIFEYPGETKFNFNGELIETKKANRVIVATRPSGAKMEFGSEVAEYLPELGSRIDVTFMAGYHYCPKEEGKCQEFIEKSINQIKRLKKGNEDLKLHFEYVPMKSREIERSVLKQLSEGFHSFGINEVEIKRVLKAFGLKNKADIINGNESAYTLYEGMLALRNELDFSRMHLHNLGYYLLLLDKDYPVSPEKVRDAALFASQVNMLKAQKGGFISRKQIEKANCEDLSEKGYDQLVLFADNFNKIDKGNFLKTGILERRDHYVLVVPAHIEKNPVATVGMGDTVSSTSLSHES